MIRTWTLIAESPILRSIPCLLYTRIFISDDDLDLYVNRLR